jgi:hypothetical protein
MNFVNFVGRLPGYSAAASACLGVFLGAQARHGG